MRRAALLLPLALLLLGVLAPTAGADHVYSHRYLIVGRVVDAQGHPVPNVTVQPGLDETLQVEGQCGNQPHTETEAWGVTITRPVTNALGEFAFCYHVHVVPSNPAPHAALRVEGVPASAQDITMDPDFRASYVVLRIPSIAGGDAAFDRVATLAGRVWTPQAGAVLEGIPVNGLTVNQAPVNITFSHDGVNETIHARTNNYGDFAVRVNLTAPVRSGTVEIESMGQRFRSPYHADLGVSYAKADLSRPGATDAVLVAAPPTPAPAERQSPGLGLVGALVAVALVARLQTRGGA